MKRDLLNSMIEDESDYDIPYDMIYKDTVKIPCKSIDKISDEMSVHHHCIYDFYKQTKYFYLFLFLVVTGLICIVYLIVNITTRI